ncbi:mechanosensitive ion channel family protein [Micromonospora sp. MS34]|uniref:mechanosensitive ion channel family protein n=1 Tax=Micromonospora sp. MS34 TaxID=3385971 RepID=UPI0039A37C18
MPKTLAVGQVDIGAALTDFWRAVLLFIPRAVAFIVILVVGWLIARAVLRIVDVALERVGFDRAVERGGVKRALERTKYDASDILAKLAYYAVLLFTLQFAFGIWGPNAISDLIRGVVAWLPRAFVAIVIVVVAAAIANAVRDLITGFLGGLSYGRVLADLTAIFILALGVIAALNQVGIATTVTTPVLIAVLATVAGILIVGVGGGLVKPMQDRWGGWLDRVAEESRAIREQRQAQGTGRRDYERQMADRGAQPSPATQQSSMAGAGQYRSGNTGDETQQFQRPNG